MVHARDPKSEGDLTLVVGSGEQKTEIQASSQVLSLASPVFAAMLSPNFAEGQSGSKVVCLPDDDVEAFTWYCNALHFRKRYNDKISFALFEKLAILCDKYDSSQALDVWSHQWLQTWTGSFIREDTHPKILWISYAFNNHSSFWNISRDLAWSYSAEELERVINQPMNGILPEGVLG